MASAEQYKKAYLEWLEKTDWVRSTIRPHELGKHLADVMSDRLRAQDALIRELTKPLTDAEEDVIYEHSHEDGWCGHDVAPASIEKMFARVIAARIARAEGVRNVD